MAGFTFKTSKRRDKFEQMIRNAQPEAAKIVKEASREVFEVSQSLVPVDTGNLKSSGYVEEKSPTLSIVGYRAPYAGFVNFGTKFMSAQAFFTIAFELGRRRFETMIADFYKRVSA